MPPPIRTQIKFLYDKAPGALIGVPCGIKFVVVDPDLQHRPARQWWKANKDRLPLTRMHRTASGGWHLLFKPHPDFRTNVTVLRTSIPAARRYIIWWPAEGLPIVNPMRLADVPDWIIEAMPERGNNVIPFPGTACRAPRTPLDTYLADNAPSAEAMFAGILRKLAQAQTGRKAIADFLVRQSYRRD